MTTRRCRRDFEISWGVLNTCPGREPWASGTELGTYFHTWRRWLAALQ